MGRPEGFVSHGIRLCTLRFYPISNDCSSLRALIRRYVTVLFTCILFSLAVYPVYGSPSLSLGSTATYGLTGSVHTSQTCTANPASYESQACYGAIYLPPQTFTVSILDDSQCPKYYNVTSLCSFTPTWITLSQGSTVVWRNDGNQTHSVVANETGNTGMPLFNSGTLPPKQVFSFTFGDVGTYHYYDSIRGRPMTGGTVNITPPSSAVVNQSPPSIQVGLTGSLGWKVVGLSSSQANLLVSHDIGLSVSPGFLVTFTPVTESGSFEQSINLSTRVESAGTTTSFVMQALSSLLPAISQIISGSGQYGGSQVSMRDLSSEPSYTQWWVNGPLTLGSPVQILQGWSSVTGSESLNLGGGIGTRQAWTVTSNLTQAFNLNIPNMNGPFGPSSAATANAKISFEWAFDKSSDILLKNNDTFSFSTLSVAPTTIYTGTGTTDVTVTRTMFATVSLVLQLSSTNLSLPGSPSQAPILSSLASMSWMSLGLAGLAAAVISGVVLWLGRRARIAAAPSTTPVVPPSAPTTDS